MDATRVNTKKRLVQLHTPIAAGSQQNRPISETDVHWKGGHLRQKVAKPRLTVSKGFLCVLWE